IVHFEYIFQYKLYFEGEIYMSVTRGLEGVIATESSICSIIDDKLTYAGYSIDDLTENATFEEVIYLLWNRELPTKEQYEALRKDLADNMQLPEAVIDHLRSYDLKTVHPMAALRTAASLLGLYDEEADHMEKEANLRKAIRLQVRVGTIVVSFSRIRKGEDPVAPRKDLTYAENFVYMLNGNEAEDIEVEAIDKALILHADHELNASTYTARVCVATLSDVYSGITAAI